VPQKHNINTTKTMTINWYFKEYNSINLTLIVMSLW